MRARLPDPPTGPSSSLMLPPALSGLAFLGLSGIGLMLSHQTEGIAALWPANAILLSALILSDRAMRWRHVAACAAAGLIANRLDGATLGIAAVLALANVLGATLAFRLLTKTNGASGVFETTASITRFLVATLIGVGAGATVAASALWLTAGDFMAPWLSWATSDLLGMLMLTPLVVTIFRRGREIGERGRLLLRGWNMWPLALILIVSILVFEQSRFPLLFVPLAAVMIATYRLGTFGAITGTLIVTAVGSLLMATGRGPVTLISGSMVLRIQFFQFYLATLYGTSMPLGALLAERARLARERSESDRRHRRILDRSREVIFETDLDGQWTYLNPAWTTLTGRSVAASLGQSLFDILVDEDWEAAADCLEPLYQQEMEECRQDLRFLHADGRVLWAGVRSYLLRDEHGVVIGTYGTIQDVTKRVEAQEARAESERLYRLLADHSNDMIVQFSPNGVRKYVSPASMAVLGFSPEELTGQPAAGAIHPEDRATVLATCRTLLEGAENPICVYRQLHKNGSYVWLEASYRMIRDEVTGVPDGFIASVRDAGHRAEAELERTIAAARLEDANRLLLMAEEMSGVGHWRVDVASNTAYWSDAVCMIHGRPNGYTPTVDTAIDAYHPDDRAMVQEVVAAALADGTGYMRHARLIRTDGAIRRVALTGRAETGPDGSVTGLFGVFQDMTEVHEAQQALVAASAAKSSFLANMSHEIRTPMNGVVGFAELLLAGDLAPEQRRQAELIADSSRAMMRLLNDILDLSKIEAGQMSVASEPYDLGHALKACMTLMAPAAERKGIGLCREFADDLPKLVIGDALRLRQIVLNLLGNATKFTLEGTITLGARTHDGDLLIEVTDTGIGIDPSRQQAIFEQFVQADSGIAPRFGGTGLGLSISNQLAALMGGGLTLDSEPGRGTRFTLSLPLRTPAVEPAIAATPVREPDGASIGDATVRVLVAEDHDVNQMLIAAMLKKLGIESDLAVDGEEAVAMVEAAVAAKRPYALVFMDMQMPRLTGIEATRRLRSAGIGAGTLPIVALTANAYRDDIATCLDAGMQGHVAKPFSLASIEAELRRWLPAAPVAGPKEAARFSPAIQERYRSRKEETLQRLDGLVRAGSFTEGELAEVATMLHKLAGTAEMFGDTTLGDEARRLETGLEEWLDPEKRERIVLGVEAMRRAA